MKLTTTWPTSLPALLALAILLWITPAQAADPAAKVSGSKARLPHHVQQLVKKFKLQPHPEGGFFGLADSRRVDSAAGEKNPSSKIYYLMVPGTGTGSKLHRLLGRTEQWKHVEGDPVEMLQVTPGGAAKRILIGQGRRQVNTAHVPSDIWQGARVFDTRARQPHGFSLVTCTVTPGFDPNQFQMADGKMIEGMIKKHGKNPVIKKMLRQLAADHEVK